MADSAREEIYWRVWAQTHSPIEVIKTLRDAENLSLAEAKDAFDRLHYAENYEERQRELDRMWEIAEQLAREENADQTN